jgi:hypothetical protein
MKRLALEGSSCLAMRTHKAATTGAQVTNPVNRCFAQMRLGDGPGTS